jgi:cytochrome c oxidase cbb3-type subunit 3
MKTRYALLPSLAVLAIASSAALAADAKQPPLGLRNEGMIATVPLGDLAGGAQSNVAAGITNPGASDAEGGRQLFIKLNCADCHGFTAKGGMGPSLVDKYWRYGGTPAQIFKSIYEGRPKGMPAWGAALSSNDIWQIVAYIESLGGTFPPSDYQAAMEGDRSNEQVAPELNFEQKLDGSPEYMTPSNGAGSSGEQPAEHK